MTRAGAMLKIMRAKLVSVSILALLAAALLTFAGVSACSRQQGLECMCVKLDAPPGGGIMVDVGSVGVTFNGKLQSLPEEVVCAELEGRALVYLPAAFMSGSQTFLEGRCENPQTGAAVEFRLCGTRLSEC